VFGFISHGQIMAGFSQAVRSMFGL
jgi:hypothetical protein